MQSLACMGACAASLLGIEVRHLPVLFVLSLLCVIVSSQHVLLTPIGVCSKQKKNARQKNNLHRDASDASLAIARLAPLFCWVKIWVCPYLRSRSYKLLHAMAPDESSIETFESSHSPKLFATPNFRSISRHDHLLRHPRCRQLLHPSES